MTEAQKRFEVNVERRSRFEERVILDRYVAAGNVFAQIGRVVTDLNRHQAGGPTASSADNLDEETARLDELVVAKERLLAVLAEKRTALINGVVTQGIEPRAELRDSGVRWLGQIPRPWTISRLAWLFHERDQRGEPDLPLLAGIRAVTGVGFQP